MNNIVKYTSKNGYSGVLYGESSLSTNCGAKMRRDE